MKKSILATVLLAVSCLFTAGATNTIGYTNGQYSRSQLFRVGTGVTQGLAFKLDDEKLKMLKGQTVSAVEVVFGSRNTTDNEAELFIATSLDATPLYTQKVTISRAAQWLTFELDSPYTITGDEGELYVGYTAEIPNTYYILSSDFSDDMPGVCYAYDNGKWIDLYGKGFGGINVRAVIGDDAAFKDVTLKPISTDGYFKTGMEYTYKAQLRNFGTEPINSFDIEISVDNAEPQTLKYENMTLANGETYDFDLPMISAKTDGKLPISVKVLSVNGSADQAQSDNEYDAEIFFYPADIQKKLLLEGFTGQDCMNCPEGHRVINAALAATDIPVVEVMHHAGYYPDIFTTELDYYCTFFYGSNTYAPGVMVNRMTNPLMSTLPVTNTSQTLLESSFELFSQRQPYVRIKLAADYNETTRDIKIRLVADILNNLPEGQNVFNLLLVQDSIKAYQNLGGTLYNHSMVTRGTLTNNSWGIIIPETLGAGDSLVWETTYNLPEAIRSDYWTTELLESKGYTESDITIPTDAKNTYIVAYVGAYDAENIDGHEIYNCEAVNIVTGKAPSEADGI
ncbi:MAG: hypothetical protein ACI4TW_07015, partial [Prevotella sp.]